jgi:hypothetical protein
VTPEHLLARVARPAEDLYVAWHVLAAIRDCEDVMAGKVAAWMRVHHEAGADPTELFDVTCEAPGAQFFPLTVVPALAGCGRH